MSQIPSSVFLEAQKYLATSQDRLVEDVEMIMKCIPDKNTISDFSFLVSPIAKAYEGYLKDFFLKIKIINEYDYESDRFRVGKTLNPSLRYKRFSVFQKLADLDDRGEELAELLWDAWKFGRNEIFHYFPNSLKNITMVEAQDRISLILSAIIKSGQFQKQHSHDRSLL